MREQLGDSGREIVAHVAARLLQLNGLRDQLVAGAKPVSGLRAEIASVVAESRGVAAQARGAALTQAETPAQAAQALSAASSAARASVAGFMQDFYENKIFDSYLRFASVEDGETYRRHAEERRRAIEKAQAERTPEGDLRANRLAIEQLKDAGAHGADRSPRYKPELDGLEATRQRLETRIAASKTPDTQERDTVRNAAPDANAGLRDAVPPELLATLSATKVSIADETRAGHGVGAGRPQPAARDRT